MAHFVTGDAQYGLATGLSWFVAQLFIIPSYACTIGIRLVSDWSKDNPVTYLGCSFIQ